MSALMKAMGLTLLAFLNFFGLLILELIAAMFVYIYLALNDRETFGYLVRQSREVLIFMQDQMATFFSEAALNQAYGTVVGELGPKSILLLLIGLGVGAVIRFLLWLFALMFRTPRRA